MFYVVLFLTQLLLLYFFSKRLQASISRFFYKLTKSQKWTAYLIALLFLPGTFIHELSHFLTALLLFVPAGKLDLIPKYDGETVKLGSVSIGKVDPLRSFLVSIAPFVFGMGIIFSVLHVSLINQFIKTWWGALITGLIVFEIGNTMFLSKSDLKAGLKLIFLFLIFFIIFYFLGFRISINFLFSDQAIDIIKKANLFLLVPLGVDFIGILIFSLFK